MNLDDLMAYLERHPDIESVTVTEVVETVLTPTVTPEMMEQMERSELWWLR